jgi:hypothetical protein
VRRKVIGRIPPRSKIGTSRRDHENQELSDHQCQAFLAPLLSERTRIRCDRGPQVDAGEPLRKAGHGVRLNEHMEHPEGAVVFQHACKMGLEGIVSKRLGSRYRSGHSPDWLKFKNPEAPAVRRETEEDWGR